MVKTIGSKQLQTPISYYRPTDTNTVNVQQPDEALQKLPQPKETIPNVMVTGDSLDMPRNSLKLLW